MPNHIARSRTSSPYCHCALPVCTYIHFTHLQNHQGINSDRSSDGNSSEHSNSFSTARRSSSNFDGLCQDGSLSRSASPKKGPQFEDLSPSNFGELELSVRKKSGDPLRVDSFDISSRYSSRSQVRQSVMVLSNILPIRLFVAKVPHQFLPAN